MLTYEPLLVTKRRRVMKYKFESFWPTLGSTVHHEGYNGAVGMGLGTDSGLSTSDDYLNPRKIVV